MNESFRMHVQEVFHFEDGTTVFAGEVTEGPDAVSAGTYELFVDDCMIGKIRIDGERSRGHVPNVRSVGTSQELSFDSDRLTGREVTFAAWSDPGRDADWLSNPAIRTRTDDFLPRPSGA